jgi:glycosyltransferase involved in cell wall biosynthesis
VAEILAKSDMLVLPSTHHEGLPIVLLEAGASDCAVITTDRGGVREVITDGQNGLITKPKVSEVEGSIMKLIEDKRLRLQLGANLRAKIEKEFTWKRIAKEYNEWLKANC